MSIPTALKYAIGAAAVAILGYGAYRGYKSAKAKISVEERNKRALQVAKHTEYLRTLAKASNDRKVVDAAVVIESPEAQQMLEVAVEAAKATYTEDNSVRKLSYKTGGIVSPDTIIKTQVTCANDLSATEQQVRHSFYTAIVAFGSQFKDPHLTFEQSVGETTKMIIDNHVNNGAMHIDELEEWSTTVKPFALPSVELIRKLSTEMDRGQVIKYLAQLDIDGVMDAHVVATAPPPPKMVAVSPVSASGTVTLGPHLFDALSNRPSYRGT